MPAETTYLQDYQAPIFGVTTVDLVFDVFEDHVLVHNRMVLNRQSPGPLSLYGEDLELIDIQINDTALLPKDYVWEGDVLKMDTTLDAFTLSITTKIYPHNNTELSGLFRSHELFCTQCEAQGFRRITFFPDRPDVLSIYTTKIIANQDRYPVLLSNGNLHSTGEAPEGRHWAVWQDPFPKPSYLFAMVVGNLACVEDTFITCTGVTVALRLYVEPGNEDQCAHALASLKRAMRWDEEQYGRVYDLSLFMIVAVSDFNMGAMENKGLNIFNAKYILARPDTATDDDYAAIESVVAHEYFHNWTGNRVTCRDWFQLSLKEGLTVFRDQEFSRDMHDRAVNRIHDVRLLKSVQFPEDAGTMAHAVQPKAYQEISNFYTATVYEKGAEIIRMLSLLLGPVGFRRGTDLYFTRHDGAAVTIDDFVKAMADANSLDLRQFKRWYHQVGTPVVTCKTTYEAGQLSLRFQQFCQASEPLYIPITIALFDGHGQALPLDSSMLVLQEMEQEFRFDGLPGAPLVSLLRDFSAPIILKTDTSDDDLLALLRYETDGFAQWDAGQQLFRAAISAQYAGKSITAITARIAEVLSDVLRDDQRNPALCAELITLPSFDDLAQFVGLVDVDRLLDARMALATALSHSLYPKIQSLFREIKAPGSAWRSLRLRCLHWMLLADEAANLPLCETLLTTASTMTEQLAGFTGLVHSQDEALRKKACAIFYARWAHDELVLDKWFSVQATAEHEGIVALLRTLIMHPDFHHQKPNKVRALLGSFVQSNPRYFHALDGEGYRFLTEQLLVIDKINPQVAARLATPFTRWERLDKPRQALIYSALKQLASQPLSNDLAELVSASIAHDL